MTENFKRVREGFWVAPQLSAEDMNAAAAAGVKLIINNRPDGEAPGQPKSVVLEAAAKGAGLAYAHIPIGREGVTPDKTEAFEKVMADHDHPPTLGFCRSGMRSVLLFSYAEARFGKPVDQIIAEAAAAGYDIAGHEPALALLHDASKTPRAKPAL